MSSADSSSTNAPCRIAGRTLIKCTSRTLQPVDKPQQSQIHKYNVQRMCGHSILSASATHRISRNNLLCVDFYIDSGGLA